MNPLKPNCAIAQQLDDAFLAGDLDAILSLLDPEIEWEIVGPEEAPHFRL
ncbi:MAG: nuclear transport factor 2 family protein [Cyanobacteria bacterium J06638_7]